MMGPSSRVSPLLRLLAFAAMATVFGGLPVHADALGSPADLSRDLTRVRAYERERIRLIERCRPAVACVFEKGSRAGGGSGVVIDADGYGLTNFHVIATMLGDRMGEAGFDDGALREFEVLGIDPTGDIAMFRLRDSVEAGHALLGTSAGLQVGDFALAMGNPFLLAEDYVPTVTLGIISGLHRYQAGAGEGGRALRYTDCIQVDTSINPGNSGGPLFDMAGRVIGINGRVSVEERGRVNVGVGYAITIDQIARFIPAMRAGLTVQHATAGFTVRDRDDRVVVDQILEDSPAFRAGLRLGDRLQEFAGREIVSANQFGSFLGVFPARWPVTVRVERDGEIIELGFRLVDMPLPEMDGGPMSAAIAPKSGAGHPVVRKANANAVRRLLTRHRTFAGEAVLDQMKRLDVRGRRELARGRDDRGGVFHLEEAAVTATQPGEAPKPADIERAVRWRLWTGALGHEELDVVGVDEVNGRICAVLRGAPAGMPILTLAMDDEGGRLMRLEFADWATGAEVRYEYAEFAAAGGLRTAHVRTIFFNNERYATETFTEIRPGG